MSSPRASSSRVRHCAGLGVRLVAPGGLGADSPPGAFDVCRAQRRACHRGPGARDEHVMSAIAPSQPPPSSFESRGSAPVPAALGRGDGVVSSPAEEDVACLSRPVPIARRRSGHDVRDERRTWDDERTEPPGVEEEPRRVLTEISSCNVLVAVERDAGGVGCGRARGADRARLARAADAADGRRAAAGVDAGRALRAAGRRRRRARRRAAAARAGRRDPHRHPRHDATAARRRRSPDRQARRGRQSTTSSCSPPTSTGRSALRSSRSNGGCSNARVPVLAIRRPQPADEPPPRSRAALAAAPGAPYDPVR